MGNMHSAGKFMIRMVCVLSALASLQSCGFSKSDLFGILKKSAADEITAFGIRTPASSGIIDESAKTISVTVPYATSTAGLVAVFTTTGETVKVNGIPQTSAATPNDFSKPVVYTVESEVGLSTNYTVCVTVAKNSAKEITSFSIKNGVVTMNGTDISVIMPCGTDISKLAPSITHTGESISPASGDPQDFSSPVTYTVTAADGSAKKYKVTASVAKNSANDISKFEILGIQGSISAGSITLTVPYGTDITALTPTIVHTGADISPASGETQDFSFPVTYTVTAADGSAKNYQVTVNTAQNSSKYVSKFEILGIQGSISADSISLTVPCGTDITALTPTIVHTGTVISPASGIPQNFTVPVTYTVTAADGSEKQYQVTVNAAKNSAKDISKFEILGIQGNISTGSITLTVPYGTDLTGLTPTIVHTGAILSPASGIPQNFTVPVTYTVTAENGSTKQYTVTVTAAPGSSNDIVAFTIAGATSTIDTNTIHVIVPYDMDVTALAPEISHTGISVSPASGAQENFSSPVSYTVTAGNGAAKSYTVTVDKEPCPISTLSELTLSPAVISFSPTTLDYSLTVDSSISSLSVHMTKSDPTETVSFNGAVIDTSLYHGKYLATGLNTITIVVTAQDSSSTTYTIHVTRNDPISVSSAGTSPGSVRTFTIPGGISFREIHATPDSVNIVFPAGASDAGTGTMSAPFLMGETEVTGKLWNLVRTWAAAHSYTFSNPGNGDGNYPVTDISWKDCVVWCNALTEYYNANNGTLEDLTPAYNIIASSSPARSAAALESSGNDVTQVSGAKGFRMPLALEWEYAARYLGTAGAAYAITNTGSLYTSLTPGYYWTPGSYASGAAGTGAADIGLVSWYSGNSGGAKHEVATKAPNALGLYDMSGNVWDRCFDISTGDYTCNKGGSFYNDTSFLPIGETLGNGKDINTFIFGLRLAQSK